MLIIVNILMLRFFFFGTESRKQMATKTGRHRNLRLSEKVDQKVKKRMVAGIGERKMLERIVPHGVQS